MPSEEIVPLGDIENIARRHFVMGPVQRFWPDAAATEATR